MGLFPRPQSNQTNGIFARLNEAQRLVNGDPQSAFQSLMRTNPQFAQFVYANQGKTPEQIATENGIDYSMVRKFMSGR